MNKGKGINVLFLPVTACQICMTAKVCVSQTQVCRQFRGAGFTADVDTAPGDTFNKKIRNAQLYHYNFIMGKGSTSVNAHAVQRFRPSQ